MSTSIGMARVGNLSVRLSFALQEFVRNTCDRLHLTRGVPRVRSIRKQQLPAPHSSSPCAQGPSYRLGSQFAMSTHSGATKSERSKRQPKEAGSLASSGIKKPTVRITAHPCAKRNMTRLADVAGRALQGCPEISIATYSRLLTPCEHVCTWQCTSALVLRLGKRSGDQSCVMITAVRKRCERTAARGTVACHLARRVQASPNGSTHIAKTHRPHARVRGLATCDSAAVRMTEVSVNVVQRSGKSDW